MRKIVIAVVFLVACLGFSIQDARGYDTCSPSNVFVPCSYSGMNYDTVMGTNERAAFYKSASNVVNHSINNNPNYWDIVNISGNHCDGRLWIGSTLWGCFGTASVNNTDPTFYWKGVGASLRFPLSGTLQNRTVLLGFGSAWTFGECPSGIYKKHAGVDLNATVDEEVYAAHNGTVKAIYTGQHAQWADAIVIEDNTGQYTTVYWHVIKYGSLSVNDYVAKGQQIATIADLSGNTHFHFGFRLGSYNSNLSLAGALPEEDCDGYPAFPENFLDPTQLMYE